MENSGGSSKIKTLGFFKRPAASATKNCSSIVNFETVSDSLWFFKNLSSFLERMKKPLKKTTLDKYGKEGVQALMAATPVDTGLTASLWHYDINMSKDSSSISFLRLIS